MKISSKPKWYQHKEIPTKFFLNLEKQKAVSTTVGHLIEDAKDITDLKKSTFIYVSFTKNLKRISLNEIRKETLV